MTTISTTGAGLCVEGGLCSAGVTAGLTACWDSGAGATYPGPPETATTWQDVIGGLQGTIVCSDNFDTANGGSTVFDGPDDFAYVNNDDAFNPASGGDMTVCVWMKPSGTSTPTGAQRLVNTVGKAAWGAYSGWVMRIKKVSMQSKWQVQGTGVSDGGSNSCKVTDASNTFNLDAWYLFSMVWDAGTKVEVYVDASKTAESTTDAASVGDIGNAIPLQVGAAIYEDHVLTDPLEYTNPYKGLIASVQIYNTALSSANITTNYNAAKARFGKS